MDTRRIRRSLPLLSLVLVGLAATALPARAQSSVWKVTSGTNVLYLGGTCHVLRPQDFPLPAEFNQAFAASTALYFETDIGKLGDPAFQQTLLARGTYRDGATLEKSISPEAWKAVQAYAARTGAPLATFNSFRPWMFTMVIASMEVQKLGATPEGVDVHFYRQALARQKATHGLESIEDHIGFLTNLGAGSESEMILSTLEEMSDLPAVFSSIVAAWRKGDMAKIDEHMIKEVREKHPKVYAELLVKRNRAWMSTIDGLVKSAPTEFILVGAAHLAGADGLLAELTKRGFKVEQVVAAK